MKQEYKIEALKESFDGERTDVFTKHVMTTREELDLEVEAFVKYHSAQRFNVWQRVELKSRS